MERNSRLLVAAGALVALATSGFAQDGQGDWSARRQVLGTSDPYRILVDKVLMQSTGWVMQPEHVTEIKAAGFNVVVPRIGADDNERVERAARMALSEGLFYMPWIRGTRAFTGDVSQRATASNGQVGSLASPNSDVLWDYWQDRVLFYAELSRTVPSVLGVFLDFENYDKVKIGGGMCYTLSYDEPILRRFAASRDIPFPATMPEDRAAWLEEQGLTKAFEDFQVNEWRARARALREKVDEVNPTFQFVVYPAGHSLFIREAVWREWHTERAPLIMAEVDTYWRHAFGLDEALRKNAEILEKRRAELDAVDPTIRYMAGLDPVVSGANPEFEGKSAVMGAEITNGYWVFYEGPTYGKPDHADNFAWFRRANDAILAKDFSLWQEPAETPNPVLEDMADSARQVAGAALVPFSTDPVPESELQKVFTHRPGARYQVLLKKGEHLRGELIALRHAHLTQNTVAVIVTPSGKRLADVIAEIGTPAVIDVEAPEDGVYGVAVNSGRAKGQLRLTNRYVCMAGPGISLVEDQPPAFVVPRRGAETLDLSVTTYVPGEHVQVAIVAPDGTRSVDKNTREECPLEVSIPLTGAPQPWQILFTDPVEDIALKLGESCEPRIATHPGRLLVE
jgi:hypothetical protein